MPTTALQEFSGINRQSSLEVAPPNSLYIGRNVEVQTGRSIRARDGWRDLGALHAQSKGLYVAGGQLRAAIPGGQGLPAYFSSGVTVVYDRIGGIDTTYTTGTVSVAKDSNIVTLTGGVWPTDAAGRSLVIGTTVTQVDARISNTVVRLTAAWAPPSVVAGTYSIETASAYPLNVLKNVTTAEQFGFSSTQGTYPYIVVERWIDPADHARGTRYEHHWIVGQPPGLSDPAATYVATPFAPGAFAVKLNGRIWAVDSTSSEIRFCSIENGPKDWLAVGDAGFISALAHAFGNRRVTGLGIYNDLLAVIFPDAVQLWQTEIDPNAIRFVRALNGPGTEAFGTVENVRGDLFYFTRGGFRSLYMQTVTGQIDENADIGSKVLELTKDIDPTGGVALWSQARSSYLCAFGDEVFVQRINPQAKLEEWSVWDAPNTIVNMVELDGKIYARGANDHLYYLDPTYVDQDPFEVQFHFINGQDRSKRKRWDFIEVVQEGTCRIDYATDPGTPTAYTSDGAFGVPPTEVTGSSTGLDRIFVGALAPSLSVRLRGNAPWTLQSLALTYKQLPW